MAIATRTPLFIHTLLLAGAISLVACGGSSGGGKPKTPDTTPNPITFSASTNADVNAVVESAPVTISGIDAAAPVTITGGEYSINGGVFTSAAGTISNGQTLRIRITASDNTNTPKEATVTVGGVSARFTVTTAPDVTPDVFSFTAKTEAAVGTEYTSDAITVKGIDIAVPVTITGGSYSINGGEFTSAAGTVSADQTITVKTTSGNATETSNAVVLTIGGVSGTFTVTTVTDTTPPVAEFKFPTPYTMSEANTVTVRGTATDDHAITDVKLVVRSFNLATPDVTISTTDVPAIPKPGTGDVNDFSSWTATIPLTENAENEIKVIATDDRNNSIEISEANKIVIRQAPVASAFPDEVNQFDRPIHLTLDKIEGRNRLLVADAHKIWAVDLETGKRKLFVDHQATCRGVLYGLTADHQNSRIYGMCEGGNLYEYNLLDGQFENTYSRIAGLDSDLIQGITLDRTNGRNQLVMLENVYEYSQSGGNLMSFSLDTKEFSLISAGDSEPMLINSFGSLAIDGDNYFIPSGGQHNNANMHKIIKVNALTGVGSIYSDNTTANGVLFSASLPDDSIAALNGIVIDKTRNQVLVMESFTNKIIAIDMNNGDRSLFKDVSYITDDYSSLSVVDMDFNEDGDFVFMPDNNRDAIIIIDLETREKFVLSKSKNNF